MKKYVWHKCTLLDNNDAIIEEFESKKGLIGYAKIDSTEYLIITIGKETMHEMQIVNTVVDNPAENIKVIMYQGGNNVEGNTYVLNVFFVYLTDKNSSTPEIVRVYLDGSDVIWEFSGIITLE